LDFDATLVTSHSDKEQAAPTYKHGFGFSPLLCFLDGTGEALAGMLRPGNANPGTAGERRPASDAGRSDRSLAILRLAARSGDLPGRWGVATSGISVHRWGRPDERRHHLIDPRTGRPAVTDVVQATVVAGTAARAEALAKAAVIAGSGAGLALLERSGVRGAILLTDRDEVVALPSTLGLLAD